MERAWQSIEAGKGKETHQGFYALCIFKISFIDDTKLSFKKRTCFRLMEFWVLFVVILAGQGQMILRVLCDLGLDSPHPGSPASLLRAQWDPFQTSAFQKKIRWYGFQSLSFCSHALGNQNNTRVYQVSWYELNLKVLFFVCVFIISGHLEAG